MDRTVAELEAKVERLERENERLARMNAQLTQTATDAQARGTDFLMQRRAISWEAEELVTSLVDYQSGFENGSPVSALRAGGLRVRVALRLLKDRLEGR